jgi:ABC-type uncharacterized transport system permease subunit
VKESREAGYLDWQRRFLSAVVAGSRPIVAIALAMLVSAVLIVSQGANPFAAYAALLKGSFGSVNALANTCVRTAPLLLGGLGIALGIQGGLFNIGAEGQLYVGAAAATAVGLIRLASRYARPTCGDRGRGTCGIYTWLPACLSRGK